MIYCLYISRAFTFASAHALPRRFDTQSLRQVTLSFSNRHQYLLPCHGACVDLSAQPPMYALVTDLCERTLKNAVFHSGTFAALLPSLIRAFVDAPVATAMRLTWLYQVPAVLPVALCPPSANAIIVDTGATISITCVIYGFSSLS